MGNKCLGQAVRPNDPQRKSDTETRVDPKTSPVPRFEGNPPAVRRAFLFHGKKARRAPVFNAHCRARPSRDCQGAVFYANPQPKVRLRPSL